MEYIYDGDTLEEIVTSHTTHNNYNSFKVCTEVKN